MLLEEFLKPAGISQYALAKSISVPPRRINEIVKGVRGISADTALRLGRYFGIEPKIWMNLQSHYDVEVAKDALAADLAGSLRGAADLATSPRHMADYGK